MTMTSTLPFLTIQSAAVNPATSSFTISFDAAVATEANIGIHTVSYTVASIDYNEVVTAISSSFTFEIKCPNSATLSEGMFNPGLIQIDLLQDT